MSFVHHVVVFAVKAQGKSSKRQKKENRKASGAKCRICEEVKAASRYKRLCRFKALEVPGIVCCGHVGGQVES